MKPPEATQQVQALRIGETRYCRHGCLAQADGHEDCERKAYVALGYSIDLRPHPKAPNVLCLVVNVVGARESKLLGVEPITVPMGAVFEVSFQELADKLAALEPKPTLEVTHG